MPNFQTFATPTPFVLCMVKPDFGRKLRVTHEFDTQEVESVTGIESRVPTREAYRLKVSYEYLMNAEEAAELRDTILSLGETRFALPLWMDDAPSADYLANRIYASQVYATYSDIQVSLNSTSLTRAVGIVIGRLSGLPKIEPVDAYHSIVKITLNEDSPWEARVETNASAIASFSFTPDWSSLVEQPKWKLSTASFGSGRELAIRGEESPVRRGQEANFILNPRTEIRQFLTFFQGQRGSHGSFDVPIWYNPSGGTPESMSARFAEDSLVLEYLAPSVARVMVRLAEEFVLAEGQPSQDRPARAWLYTLQFEGGTVKRYTSWEKPLIFGGDTFEPKQIEHKAFTQSLKPEGDEVELSCDNFDGCPLRAFIFLELERKLLLVIRECDPANVAAAEEIFNGEVLSAKATGKTLVASAATLGGALRRQLPRYFMQTTCNLTLGDDHCGKSLPALKRTGILSTQAGSIVDVTTGAGEGENYYADGWAVFGSGVNAEKRAIVSSDPIGGGQRLHLHKPLKQTGAIAVEFYPGCDGQWGTCVTKYANGDNFGGFPLIPAFIESVATGFTPKLGK